MNATEQNPDYIAPRFRVELMFSDGRVGSIIVSAKDRRNAIKQAEREHGGCAVSAKNLMPMSGGGSKRG